MTVVQQVLYKPGTAVPWANAKVTVALVGPGFVTGGQVLGEQFGLSDTTGLVSFDLTSTVGMTPTGCYYVWTGPDGVQYAFTVPASGGPFTLLQSLIAAPQNPNVITGVSSVDGHSGAVDLSDVYASLNDAGELVIGTTRIATGGMIVHGTDPTVARPAGADAVTWVGTVQPNNWQVNDTWIDPSDNVAATWTPTIPDGSITYAKLGTDARAAFDSAGAAAAKTGIMSAPVTATTAFALATLNETEIFRFTVSKGKLTVAKALRFFLHGSTDNIATSGILTFAYRLLPAGSALPSGGVAGGTPAQWTGAFSSQASAGSNKKFVFDLHLTTRSTGSGGAGTAMLGGVFSSDFAANGRVLLGTGNATNTVDTTQDLDVIFTATAATINAITARVLGGFPQEVG